MCRPATIVPRNTANTASVAQPAFECEAFISSSDRGVPLESKEAVTWRQSPLSSFPRANRYQVALVPVDGVARSVVRDTQSTPPARGMLNGTMALESGAWLRSTACAAEVDANVEIAIKPNQKVLCNPRDIKLRLPKVQDEKMYSQEVTGCGYESGPITRRSVHAQPYWVVPPPRSGPGMVSVADVGNGQLMP